MRIDKFLWAVRIYKTRSIATDACNCGKITIGNQNIKPSRNINVGDIIKVRKPMITYTYKVKGLTPNRVGAKLVFTYLEDITPKEEMIKFDLARYNKFGIRDRGTGRPTKRDRRMIDGFFDVDDDQDDENNFLILNS